MGATNIVQALVGVLVMVLTGGVAWMRGDIAENTHKIEKLEDSYHELDKKTDRIQKDVDVVKDRTKRIEQKQDESIERQNKQVEILERLDRRGR